MSSKSSSSGGISFLGMLTILFIGLKLTHFIDWSWWWVLSPLWGMFALFFGIIICGGVLTGVVAGLFAVLGVVFKRRKRRPFR